MLKTPEERQEIAEDVISLMAEERVTFADAQDILSRAMELLADRAVMISAPRE